MHESLVKLTSPFDVPCWLQINFRIPCLTLQFPFAPVSSLIRRHIFFTLVRYYYLNPFRYFFTIVLWTGQAGNFRMFRAGPASRMTQYTDEDRIG